MESPFIENRRETSQLSQMKVVIYK